MQSTLSRSAESRGYCCRQEEKCAVWVKLDLPVYCDQALLCECTYIHIHIQQWEIACGADVDLYIHIYSVGLVESKDPRVAINSAHSRSSFNNKRETPIHILRALCTGSSSTKVTCPQRALLYIYHYIHIHTYIYIAWICPVPCYIYIFFFFSLHCASNNLFHSFPFSEK